MAPAAVATTTVAEIQIPPIRIQTDQYLRGLLRAGGAGRRCSSRGSDRRSAADASSISASAPAS
jgi:hypothetical protein